MIKKTVLFILVACIGMAYTASSASAAAIEPDIEPTATHYRSAYVKIDLTDIVRSFRSNTYEWTPARYSISDR